MNHDEFVQKYTAFALKAKECAVNARKEGLSSLWGVTFDFDNEEAENRDERDIFYYGLRFITDNVPAPIINTILTNLIEQEKDEYSRLLKTIKKAAVFHILGNVHPRLLCDILNSYTDIPPSKDKALEWDSLEDIDLDLGSGEDLKV